jgi:hypothetical protein
MARVYDVEGLRSFTQQAIGDRAMSRRLTLVADQELRALHPVRELDDEEPTE